MDTSKQIAMVRQRYQTTGITPARQMNNIGREINKLSMSQDLSKTPTGYRYAGAGVDASFSGTAYVSGRRTTGLNSDSDKPWVKVDVSLGTAVEADGPPSNPFPANEEWYEKANTYGDIHVTRL